MAHFFKKKSILKALINVAKHIVLECLFVTTIRYVIKN